MERELQRVTDVVLKRKYCGIQEDRHLRWVDLSEKSMTGYVCGSQKLFTCWKKALKFNSDHVQKCVKFSMVILNKVMHECYKCLFCHVQSVVSISNQIILISWGLIQLSSMITTYVLEVHIIREQFALFKILLFLKEAKKRISI